MYFSHGQEIDKTLYLLQDDFSLRKMIKVKITNCVNIKSSQGSFFLYWPIENVQFYRPFWLIERYFELS